MTACPFCKASVREAQAHAPCARCGKLASTHPSASATAGRTLADDFDDDDPLGGGLDLQRGGSLGGSGEGSSYEGGSGMSFDDDFDDHPGGGALELDMPQASTPLAPELPLEAPGRPSGHGPISQGPISHRPISQRNAPSVSSSPTMHEPAGPPSMRTAEAAPVPVVGLAPARPTAASVVAKYPAPPNAIWEAPIYACKVLWRQFELRQDLEALRKKRSPDVPLYEAALHAHDKKAFTLGLAITCAALALASFVFFLPVILRFVRAPD